MHLDAILEVAIGLVMTWLIISAATSQLQEFFAELLGSRASFLKKRIEEMFNDEHIKDATDKLYKHSLIRSLETTWLFGAKRQATDIPKQIFAQVVAELYPNIPQTEEKRVNDLKEVIGIKRNTITPTVKSPDVLKTLMPKLDLDGTKYLKNIEEWFDAKMKDASNIYRRNVVIASLCIGFLLAIAFNVDSIFIANQLWKDPTLRQAIIAQADGLDPNNQPNLTEAIAKINELSIPIGWEMDSQGEQNYRFFGWLITGLAAGQGAPFWFDILRNLTGLKKSEPSQKPKTE